MRAERRDRVVLPPLAAETAATILAPPRLPAAAAAQMALVRRAGAATIPVVLAVPAAAGRQLLARALHAAAGRGGPLIAVAGRRSSFDALPAGATIYLDAGILAADARLALEAVLDDASVWVLAGIEPGTALSDVLAARLAAVVVEVPPLAARTGELPELAGNVLARLAARAGHAAPALSPAALARLTAHRWAGDMAELEAVLARAMLVAAGERIDVEHLLLAPPPAIPAPTAPPQAPAGADLEFVLAELAHELRNPMVTIKTFARHLPALLEDAELRTRFETLTDEAIDRMDTLLENVLAFARLGPPRPEPVDVGTLLARVLADMEADLAGRALHVRQEAAPSARCAADPEHLAYALRNLFAGVVREVPAREELALQATTNGVVTLRFAAGAEAADRLRRLAAPTDQASLGDPTLLPISFRLARAVLERNGGTLAVVPAGAGATSVVIRLPTPPAGEAE